ncbi:MAG TPA: DUF1549 domain-containing protein [Pirellulales bacterium]|jgi:hypothetical protein|nr:DUF1549 domain-containing protein [Pirellulales bacterium]
MSFSRSATTMLALATMGLFIGAAPRGAPSAAPKSSLAATTAAKPASSTKSIYADKNFAGKNSTPIPKIASTRTPAEVAAKADALLQEELLSTSKTAPTARCNDATFLRRATLDLTGEIPTPDELEHFAADKSPDKRAKLVEALLAKPDYGVNWAHYWRDVIMARRAEDRSLLVAMPLTKYLTEELNKNTPWDQLARSFITAKGSIDENGDTAIIMAQMGNTEDVTSEITRIFMGIQISCANCHNHPTDRWQREQFHELAAFFPRVEVRPMKVGEKRSFEVIGLNRDPLFKGNNMIRRASAEHYMPDLKNPAAKGTRMEPVFFATGDKLSPGKSDEERRRDLANWLTSPRDEWFAKAIINRLWSELVGEGFYEPVDDMGPDRQCSAPKTMQLLAVEFVGHDYDVKWLYRTIMTTSAYQRESRSRRNPDETPFIASTHQQLRADQIFTSLTKALGIHESFADTGVAYRPRGQARNPRAQFDAVFNYDPSTRRDEISGSIPQALMLMNSYQLARFEKGTNRATDLGRLLAEEKNDEKVVVDLYRRALARDPQSSEVQTCLTYVKKSNSRSEAFEDILWSLVNCTEFLHRK